MNVHPCLWSAFCLAVLRANRRRVFLTNVLFSRARRKGTLCSRHKCLCLQASCAGSVAIVHVLADRVRTRCSSALQTRRQREGTYVKKVLRFNIKVRSACVSRHQRRLVLTRPRVIARLPRAVRPVCPVHETQDAVAVYFFSKKLCWSASTSAPGVVILGDTNSYLTFVCDRSLPFVSHKEDLGSSFERRQHSVKHTVELVDPETEASVLFTSSTALSGGEM